MAVVATDPMIGLPRIRGSYRFEADLAKTTWFRAGGRADVLFRPADEDDLAFFMTNRPLDMPVTVLGVGSNLLVRDGGIPGVTIRLGRGFTDIAVKACDVTAGTGALDLNVAKVAAQAGVAGLEFLVGVPGTIGGAVRMNAGAYEHELKDVLVGARAVDPRGVVHELGPDHLGHNYRHSSVPEGWVFTACSIRGTDGAPGEITARMEAIQRSRAASQPIRERTGGSTFRNPMGRKAWELIDAAGCRGLRRGAAMVSEQHCNFLINTGNASATELEELGEDVRRRVFESQGVRLEWEIRRIGRRPGRTA
ncbi:MAG: UDP-N-acetylmuramate dehydrogenase [Rhodospirillales bacterium]|nr:UDP-N-acetylmuramate dehydrogenase [Rhodospirillales bacterium]